MFNMKMESKSFEREKEYERKKTHDSIAWFLSSISREPLLTAAEEIVLGNHVQQMMRVAKKPSYEWTNEEKSIIRLGKKSKERMMRANLRLVVSIAKKYQQKGLEIQDLVQEGALGLEKAVEKFDPTRGYKFSTYAFWWIRQSMTRAIATQSRSIRLPVHLSEKLILVKRVTHDLTQKYGSTPSRVEIASTIGLSSDELDLLLRQSLSTCSLDEPISASEGKSFLGDLIPDQKNTEPMEDVEMRIYTEQLTKWLYQLNEQERNVIELRFGLAEEGKKTLTEIGLIMGVSRERVRQIELKALRKLRGLTRRMQIEKPTS